MTTDECLVGVDREGNGWEVGWLMWLVGLIELIAWVGLVDADGLAFDGRHG